MAIKHSFWFHYGHQPIIEQTLIFSITRDNLTLHSVPPPGSGAVLTAVLNIMQQVSLSFFSIHPSPFSLPLSSYYNLFAL